MLIKNICKNKKIVIKIKNMIRGIHYFSTELKTKIDVIPSGCFKSFFNIIAKRMVKESLTECSISCNNDLGFICDLF